jgi:endoglucanase
MGFRFLRFPVCFDLWYANEAPYALLKPSYYQALDSIIKWTGEKQLLLSIDYHHGTLESDQLEPQVKRICFIWSDIARRYKHLDAERVFFELFNEPNRINETEWQDAASSIIQAIRKEAPHHTLIVGATKWNSLSALLEMPLLSDNNLIYTFHFYDPFLFTHQGASWTGDPTATIGMPYPYRIKDMPEMNEKAQATWAKRLYEEYPVQANYSALYSALKGAANWSKRHHVPVFCGEWGAYKKYAPVKDRCQYINDMYTILTDLQIPNSMWEWDAGFSFFQDQPSEEGVDDCLKKAMRLE